MSENEKITGAEEIMKNAPEYPERASDNSSDRNPAEGIYAGPPPMPQPMGAVYAGPVAMMTYAGPNMMNNGGVFIGTMFQQSAAQQPAPVPKQPADPDSIVCDMCGSIIAKGSKFCSECGHPLGGNQ